MTVIRRDDAIDVRTRRSLLTRDEMRASTAAYTTTTIALVAWPDKSTWTTGTVIAIGLGGLILGWLAWILFVERRMPRPSFRSKPREPVLPGAMVVALIVFIGAFLISEWLRNEWPRDMYVFNEPPPPAGADGYVVADFTIVEIPVNVARHLIAYLGVGLGGLVLGSALLQGFHAWRARRREVWT